MSAQPVDDAVVDIRHVPGASRFEVVVDGAVAGFAAYRREGDAFAFTHTEVSDEYEGRGLASRLVRAALETVAADDGTVLPYCPFVRSYLQRHRDLAHLVPAARRGEFGLD